MPLAPLPRPFGFTALALLALFTAAVPVRADDPVGRALDRAIAPLRPLARTGAFADRVLPLAGLERFDGGPASPVADLATWRQAYDELRRASWDTPAGPSLEALAASARSANRRGVVPLAILDRGWERVRPGALDDGVLRVVDGRLEPVGGEVLEASRAFVATALVPRTHRGAEVAFALDAERYFGDGAPPASIEVDLADGRGLRAVRFGAPVVARYDAPGPRTLRAVVRRADGSRAESRFAFEVAALVTPSPQDTMPVTASLPWGGQFGSGEAYVYLGAGHTTLTNPVVVVEGFDLDNSMNWDELYALLNRENLLETLRADGFDAVVLNFTDATEDVQQNAFVVAELIQQVQAAIAPTTTIAVVGASMGGLCSRYALAYMETHAMPHRVRTWISFDSPQSGADIPLGLQHWIQFFSGQSAEAAAFLATLQRPAARQLLLYHYTGTSGTTAQADPLRTAMLADFAAVGGWPAQPRRVAVANGASTGATQGFAPLAQVIRWEYSSLLVAITGNVWALPDAVNGRIFQGSLRILFSTTTQSVNVAGTRPWDSAPGGWRSSFAELDATAAPYGDILALAPNHCFIPAVSALAIPTADPFFDIDGTPNLASLTPFDAVYAPVANQEHVLITPENAVWVRSEIEAGVVSVPADAGATLRLTAAPNPASGVTRISFTLPRACAAEVRVFGVDGRAVRSLARGAFAAGTHGAAWDGRDEAGARVAPGVYFVRLAAGDESSVARVVRVE